MRTTTITIVPISDGVPLMLAPANANRVRIEFYVASDTTCLVSIGDTPQTSPTSGFTFWSTDFRFNNAVFTLRDHGSIVKSAWYGFPSSVQGQSPSLAIVETFLQ